MEEAPKFSESRGNLVSLLELCSSTIERTVDSKIISLASQGEMHQGEGSAVFVHLRSEVMESFLPNFHNER